MTVQVTASMVKDLREKTGAGMMDVRNALQEAEGDMERATEILRQKGTLTAEKKSGRAAAEGLIQALISPDGTKGVMVEVNSETDFVARNEQFINMVDRLAEIALESKAADMDTLLAEQMSNGGTVMSLVTEAIAVIKEHMSFRRFARFETNHNGLIQAYIHTNGKIGVLLELDTDSRDPAGNPALKDLAKNLTLQIASSAPEFVSRDEISQDYIANETRIEMGKEDLQSKPEQIREKIVAGRVDKLLAERVLLEQSYVKDPSKTLTEVVAETAKQIGSKIDVKRFVRYGLGEGIDKPVDTFVEEVMAAQAHA